MNAEEKGEGMMLWNPSSPESAPVPRNKEISTFLHLVTGFLLFKILNLGIPLT